MIFFHNFFLFSYFFHNFSLFCPNLAPILLIFPPLHRIKLYGGNTVGRWNWKRNQYLAVFNFIWLGAQYRPTMAHRHAISLYIHVPCNYWTYFNMYISGSIIFMKLTLYLPAWVCTNPIHYIYYLNLHLMCHTETIIWFSHLCWEWAELPG